MSQTFLTLRDTNVARQAEWDQNNQITLSYRGNELAGEVGEACNIIKKLDRERMGIAGSRATREQLAEELADVIICADLIAMHEGINLLGEAVPAKFNATTAKVGLTTLLASSSDADLPFPKKDIERGLILFRISNNSQGYTNFSLLSAKVDGLPQAAKCELAQMMRSIADDLAPPLLGSIDKAGDAETDDLIERCAQAAEAMDRIGYEWVRDSLWANILRRAGANVRALKNKAAAGLRRVRHKKRGSTYVVLGYGFVQTDTPLTDYSEVVIYRADDGSTWVRPTSEFEDGRFEEVSG